MMQMRVSSRRLIARCHRRFWRDAGSRRGLRPAPPQPTAGTQAAVPQAWDLPQLTSTDPPEFPAHAAITKLLQWSRRQEPGDVELKWDPRRRAARRERWTSPSGGEADDRRSRRRRCRRGSIGGRDAYLLARPHEAPLDVPRPRPSPSLKHAVGLLGFAVLFALAMWLEHRWLLARGGYPGIITWLALAVCVGRLFWVSRTLFRRW
jgi:hypothetical protein